MTLSETIISTLKISAIIILIVVVLAFIEISIAKKTNNCCYELPDCYMKINPPCINSKKPIFVYNCNKDCKKQLKISLIDYEKSIIPEHISTTITKPLKNIKNGFTEFFTSGTPINSLINTIGNCKKLTNVTNPLSTIDCVEKKWKILYPKGTKIKCFIDNNKIYFM